VGNKDKKKIPSGTEPALELRTHESITEYPQIAEYPQILWFSPRSSRKMPRGNNEI
jgi:hypothetical protein